MYKDQGVEGYYDMSLLGDYKLRYNLFMLAVLATGLVAIIIPFVLRWYHNTESVRFTDCTFDSRVTVNGLGTNELKAKMNWREKIVCNQ